MSTANMGPRCLGSLLILTAPRASLRIATKPTTTKDGSQQIPNICVCQGSP